MKIKRHLLRSFLIAMFAWSTASARVDAQTLTWDPGLSTTKGTDGAGTWDSTTANWYAGTTTLSPWVNGDNVDFGSGGTGGTVTLGSTTLSAATVAFLNSGYVLSGNALNLTATGQSGANSQAVYAAAGVGAELDNNLTLGTSGTAQNFYFGAGNGGTLTLTGGVTTANAFSSIIFNGATGNVALTGGAYAMNGFITTAPVTESGTVTVSTKELKVASFGASTLTINSTASGTAFTSSGAGGQDFIGGSGGVGTLDLKAGTVSFTKSLYLTEDALNNTGVYSQGSLKIEGGATTVGTGGIVVNFGGTVAGQSGSMNVSGGTLTTPLIQFGGGSTAYNATTTGSLSVSGGTIYVGAGGIVENTVHPTTDTITLSGGTIGATAAWTSSLNMTLSNSGGGVTIQAANSSGTAFNIGLSGNLTGSGSLTKTGAGILTLSGANAYTGGTTVSGGNLTLASATTLQSATGTVMVQGGSLTSSVTNATLGSSLSIASGNTIPGSTGTVGTLTLTSSKNFNMSGGSLMIDLGANTATSDQIASAGSGTFAITSGTLALNLLSGFNSPASYGTAYGIFSGFTGGSVSNLTITGYDTTDYRALLSNAGVLSFTATPEPSTWVMMLVLLALVISHQCRKSRVWVNAQTLLSSSQTLLLAGGVALSFVSLCLSAPIQVPNGDLSEIDSSGYPSQWGRRQWKNGAPVPAELKIGEGNGKICLQVPAQATGAVGWESPRVPVQGQQGGLTMRWEIKVTDIYGNRPWVFVAWYKDGRYISRTDAKVATPSAGAWSPQSWTFTAKNIPEGATDMAFVFASIADADSKGSTGTVSYRSFSLETRP